MGHPISSTTGPQSLDDCVVEANQTTLRRWRVLMSTTVSWDRLHPTVPIPEDPENFAETFGGRCPDSWVIVEAPNKWAAADRARDGITLKEPAWITRARDGMGLLFVETQEIRR